MPTLLSHYRPDMPIYCFTESREVQRRLALYHGVTAIYLKFLPSANETFDRCLAIHGHVAGSSPVYLVPHCISTPACLGKPLCQPQQRLR